MLDDVLVYHLSDESGPFYLMVVNASNRQKILAWIADRLPADVQCTDQTLETAMIAVQGPRALQLTKTVVGFDASSLKYYRGKVVTISLQGGASGEGGVEAVISRTGYTGEDGCELMVTADWAERLWQQLVDRGGAVGARPAGLGARDTLRLEAAMPLYGHEIDETITPLQAGLEFAVELENRQFPGRDALVGIQKGPALPRRVGLECFGRRVPRDGYAVMRDGEEVGRVTSGGFSPTLQKPIAMAYVVPSASGLGTQLTIDVRGRGEPARVVPLPFYQRE